MSEKNFPRLHEVTMYQARCTNCGYIEDDYGDYTAWGDEITPIEDVVNNMEWFEPEGELLCPACQKCEVCGADDAHDVNGYGHLVCGEHEEHDFNSAVTA